MPWHIDGFIVLPTCLALTFSALSCEPAHRDAPWRVVHGRTGSPVAVPAAGDRATTTPTVAAPGLPLGMTAATARAAHPFADLQTSLVALPKMNEDLFPCSQCHEPDDFDPTPRVLEDEHDTITLDHGATRRWCFDCHHPQQRDTLRLAGGVAIPFSQSHRLCGQCHGKQLRLWRVGVHGKRTGSWSGAKKGLSCVHCHRPHSPRFRAFRPEPAPKRPVEIGLPTTITREGQP